MFCPNCLSEYQDESTWCEECGVELVEGEESEVVYLPFLEVTDADLFARVTEKLEDAGIAWFVQSEESLGLLPRDGQPEPGAPGDRVVTLYVDKTRLARARERIGLTEAVAAG